MAMNQKFGVTLKEKSLKYLVRATEVIDMLPNYLAHQLLAKQLILATITLTTQLAQLADESNPALLPLVISSLHENKTILKVIEISKRFRGTALQALQIETNELIIIAERANKMTRCRNET